MFDKYSTINYQTGEIETYHTQCRISGHYAPGGVSELFVLLALIVGALTGMKK